MPHHHMFMPHATCRIAAHSKPSSTPPQKLMHMLSPLHLLPAHIVPSNLFPPPPLFAVGVEAWWVTPVVVCCHFYLNFYYSLGFIPTLPKTKKVKLATSAFATAFLMQSDLQSHKYTACNNSPQHNSHRSAATLKIFPILYPPFLFCINQMRKKLSHICHDIYVIYIFIKIAFFFIFLVCKVN